MIPRWIIQIVLICIFSLIPTTVSSMNVDSLGGTDTDYLFKVDVDSNSTTYGCGYFFDSATIGKEFYSSTDNETGYVVAYHPNSTSIWTTFVDGMHDEKVVSVSANYPAVFITGFSNSNFYTIDDNGQTNLNFPNYGMFIAKLSATNGTVIWQTHKSSGSGGVIPQDIASDTNKVCVVGYYSGHISLNGSNYLPNTTSATWFVACYGTSTPGDPIWSFGFAGNGSTDARAVGIESVSGDVFVMGYVETSVSFLPPLSEVICSGCIVMVRIDNNGTGIWSKEIQGSGELNAWDMAITSNAIYIFGTCLSSFSLDAAIVLCSTNGPDPVLLVFSLTNTYITHLSFIAAGNQQGMSVSVNGQQIIVAGNYDGSPDFGLGPIPYSSSIGTFVAGFSMNISALWSVGFPASPSNTIQVFSVAAGNTSFALGGAYQGTVTLGTTPLNSVGSVDGFVATSVIPGATPSASPSQSPGTSSTPTATPVPSGQPTPSSSPFTSSTPTASVSGTPTPNDDSSSIPITAIAAGSGAGGGTCIVIVVVAAVFWFRRKKKHEHSDTISSEWEEMHNS